MQSIRVTRRSLRHFLAPLLVVVLVLGQPMTLWADCEDDCEQDRTDAYVACALQFDADIAACDDAYQDAMDQIEADLDTDMALCLNDLDTAGEICLNNASNAETNCYLAYNAQIETNGIIATAGVVACALSPPTYPQCVVLVLLAQAAANATALTNFNTCTANLNNDFQTCVKNAGAAYEGCINAAGIKANAAADAAFDAYDVCADNVWDAYFDCLADADAAYDSCVDDCRSS